MASLRIALVSILCLSGQLAGAQGFPFVLRDINEIATGRSGDYPARVGDVVYFAGNDGVHGEELWRTDGTAEGTRLVHDLAPGGTSSTPGYLGSLGSLAFFEATRPSTGYELWVTDGTPDGTVFLKDIRPGDRGSSIGGGASVGGWFLFGADDGVHGRELWRSDGTPEGTELLVDIVPGPSGSTPGLHGIVEGVVLFEAGDPVHGLELWRTDGSAAGTWLVADVRPGPSGSFWSQGRSIVSGGLLYMTRDDGVHGLELWRSDGTAAGTTIVADIRPGEGSSVPSSFVEFGGEVFFRAGGGFDDALWKTDGTAEGTQLVHEVMPFGNGKRYQVLGDLLLFGGKTYDLGYELWRTDGTPEGTTRVLDIYPGAEGSFPNDFIPFGGEVFFSANDGERSRLWRSDGTAAGTTPMAVGGSDLTPLDDRFLFWSGTPEHGGELWASDGTSEGTAMVLDLFPGTESSEPRMAVALGDMLLFTADDGLNGRLLWRTDRVEGAKLVTDRVLPGTLVARFEDRVLFSGWTEDTGAELWLTDGTDEGTTPWVESIPGPGSASPSGPTIVGDRVFYRGRDDAHGMELWASDGTPAGTGMVTDLVPGAGSPFSTGFSGYALGDMLLFRATTAEHGFEMWRSDGTAEGTTIVKDVGPGTRSGWFGYPLRVVGGRAFFGGDDGVAGQELWITDGTEAGTRLLKDIAPGERSSRPTHLTDVDGTLLFIAQSSNDDELWKSDGTPEGTVLVRADFPGRHSPYVQAMVEGGGRVYFTVGSHIATGGGVGVELWTSDGTHEGTFLVDDLRPGPEGSRPYGFGFASGFLYFGADDGTLGNELWRTNGVGAELVADLVPGAAGSGVAFFGTANGQVFLSADDGVLGEELWGLSCGNGVREQDEECDLGATNGSPSSCCDGGCRLRPDGSSCDDACRVGSSCLGGACGGGVPVVCEECLACDAERGCVPDVREVCHPVDRGRSAEIRLRRKARPGGDRLRWVWKGRDVPSDALGDPVSGGDDYELCVFDANGDVVFGAEMPAGGTCGNRPCWRTKPNGVRYRDRQAERDGITRADVSHGDRSKARVVGRGEGLELPDLPSLLLPLEAQLRTPHACWEATFTTSGVLQHDARRLRAFAVGN